MPLFYVTFPQRTSLRDSYVKTEALDERHARKKIYRAYGNNWEEIYTEHTLAPDNLANKTQVEFGQQSPGDHIRG